MIGNQRVCTLAQVQKSDDACRASELKGSGRQPFICGISTDNWTTGQERILAREVKSNVAGRQPRRGTKNELPARLPKSD